MHNLSKRRESEDLGESVAALALAHQRVVETRTRIERFEDLSRRLRQAGQAEASEAVMSRVKTLRQELSRAEVMLTVISYTVRDNFHTATAHDALPGSSMVPPSRESAAKSLGDIR